MSDPFVSVIIVNYNSGGRLKKCLARLTDQSFQDFEILVVDNGSEDGSETAAAMLENGRLFRAGVNLGFAAANNLAAKEAKGEWLAFLNPDAYADREWLSEFKTGAARHPNVDAFGSAQYDAQDAMRIDGAGDVCHGFGLYYRGACGWRADKMPAEGECFSPCAAAAFYKRAVFSMLGGFDERFFCYGEDIDLGFRLRRHGRRAVQLKNAVVYHEGSGVTGRNSAFTVYHGVRNRLWLYAKNFPPLLFYGLAPLHVAVNLLMLTRATLRGRAGAYWRGLRDGVAGLSAYRNEWRYDSDETRHSTRRVFAMLSWSPMKLLRRGPDIRRTRY